MNEEPQESAGQQKDLAGPSKMKCDDIQAVLFDYMTRELGQARSELVGAHLKKCQQCQQEAAEIGETLSLLQNAAQESDLPEHLSDEYKKRMFRAITHPIIDWIDRHHILVSLIIALLCLGVVFNVLRKVRIWKQRVGPGVSVIIREALPDSKPEVLQDEAGEVQDIPDEE